MDEENVMNNAEEELIRARAENDRLRNELLCARLGIPMEAVGDIICMAAGDIEGGMDPEEAFGSAYGRMKKFAGSITTGIRSERTDDGDDALRRAFGLKQI